MSEENTTANVEADQNTTEIQNTSLEEFTQRRLGAQSEAVTAEVEEPTESSEESAEETEVEATEVEEAQSEENVLSQLDINNLSEDELRELGKKMGSRAVARFGEMTAARKAAEERVAQLESMLQSNQEKPAKEIRDNPFSDLDSMDKIETKSEEIDSTIEWAETVLFESDDYSADDVVTEVDGKELTKKEIRKALLNARKAKKDYIPDQLRKVQSRVQGKEIQKTFDAQARKELEWLQGEDNEIRQQFFATLRDPNYNRLKTIVDKELPEISGRLEYMFAHAANSIYGRKPIATDTPKKTTTTKKSASLTPTKTGNTSSAKSEKPTNKTKKALADLQNRFQKTGSARDFAEMRKLQMQNR